MLAGVAGLLAVLVAVALVYLFMGDPAPAAGPTPSAPTRSTPEPTPTVAPVLEPTVPFGGDCAQVLTAAQLDALLGEGWMTEEEARADWGTPHLPDMRATSLGTLGGLECEWYPAATAERKTLDLGVIVLPAAEVPSAFAAAYAEMRCDPAYDATGCRLGKQSGDFWVMTRAYGASEGVPEELLVGAADAVAATVGDSFDGVAADRQESWATLPDCATLSESSRLSEVLGAGYVNGYWEGVEQPEETMLTTAGVGLTCPWFSVDGSAPGGQHFIIAGTVGSGASWAWDQIAATEGAEPVTVAGAVDAVAFDVGNDHVWLFATDGVNVIQLNNAAVTDLIPIAERMLETLAN